MPVPEVPAALSKKVVDATLLPWEILPVIKAQSQIQYFIEGVGSTRFGNTTFQVSMNQARRDSLPDDIQQAFRDASGPDGWAEGAGAWRGGADFGIKMATDAGKTHILLPAEETAAMRDAMAPVTKRGVGEGTAKGLDGAGLVETAKQRIAKHGGAM